MIAIMLSFHFPSSRGHGCLMALEAIVLYMSYI